MTVPLIINDPGHFYAIGALQFYTYDRTRQQSDAAPFAEYRYDVANALDMNLINYQEQAEILSVTTGAKIAAIIMIALACASIGFLLFQTIKHRKNNIMRVSQGNFLIVFLVAGIWATVSAVFFNPKNNGFCNSVYPMVLVPLQLMFSITIGRLWRIQAVISPLLKKKMNSEPGFGKGLEWIVGRFMSLIGRDGSQRRIRRTVSGSQLGQVIALFTLPQVIMQVVGYLLDPDQQVVEFNDDESTGRMVCESRLEPWTSFRMYSVFLLLILFFILLLVSYRCRDLPSLLNETTTICTSTIESLIAMAVAFAILITDSPTTSPNIAYLVLVALTITLTLNHTWRIMLPKLRMVWRGETVVISKLVSDERRKDAEREERVNASLQGVSGFRPGASALASSVNSAGRSISYTNRSSSAYGDSEASNEEAGLMQKSENDKIASPKQENVTGVQVNQEEESMLVSQEETVEDFQEEDTGACATQEDHNDKINRDSPTHVVRFSDIDTTSNATESPPSHACPASPKSSALRARPSAALNRKEEFGERRTESPAGEGVPEPASQDRGRAHRRHRHHHEIRISDDETPTRRLVLRMVDLNSVLTRVNQRILSGLVVEHEDWKTLQEASVDLGTVFRDDVRFKWEETEEDEDII